MSELKPVYVLTGGDRPKIVRALARLRDRLGHVATETLSAYEASGDDVVAACNALGLFGEEQRLLIVEDVERWKAADVEAVARYMADPAPTTVLALVAAELKAGSPLAKAAKRVGEVLVYELPKRGARVDLPRWVATQFAARNLEADAEACRALVELVGDDPQELATEIDKLGTWAGDEPIQARDIAAVVVPRAEIAPFALTDALGRRDAAGALAASEQLLERSPEHPRDLLTRLAGLITSHVNRLAECQALAAEGVPPRDAAERMKRNRFYVQKLYEQAGSFSVEQLRDAIVRLARLDHALKGGSKLPGELELDRTLVEITRGEEAERPA